MKKTQTRTVFAQMHLGKGHRCLISEFVMALVSRSQFADHASPSVVIESEVTRLGPSYLILSYSYLIYASTKI